MGRTVCLCNKVLTSVPLLQDPQTRQGELGMCKDMALNPKLFRRASACIGVVGLGSGVHKSTPTISGEKGEALEGYRDSSFGYRKTNTPNPRKPNKTNLKSPAIGWISGEV